jgi:hypothetical protein
MESTPRKANQPTQQPSSRKHPVDRQCMQSRSDRSPSERRYLVKYDLILWRQFTNAEGSKVKKQTIIYQFLSSKCGVKLKLEKRRVKFRKQNNQKQNRQRCVLERLWSGRSKSRGKMQVEKRRFTVRSASANSLSMAAAKFQHSAASIRRRETPTN